MTTPLSRRMIEVPRSEAPWLLEGGAQGHLVYVRREISVLRPAVHIREHGRLIVRTPAQATALACQPDEITTAGEIGWTVTTTGPAEIITDPHEADHYRRALPGWAHGAHDTLVRIRPQTMTGFRLPHAQAVR
ncbi:pyridoxamine 5'-phosphate oxidase family protein [Streptomyces sp. NPDC005181]|uniref:pyridoxamine 5'-phosphate oxidase family protein n=1 Tax=Streptomyces sp. NPDC005181 TaxID=3156869 RepID=UPI0033A140DF